MDHATGFDCERRQVRVRGQITPSSCGTQISEDQFRVPGSGIDDPHDAAAQPGFYVRGCGIDRHGILEHTWIRPQANEAEGNDPGDPYGCAARQAGSPPLTRSSVPGRCRVVSVDQQIDIRNDHNFPRVPDGRSFLDSRTSGSQASSLKRRSSIPVRSLPGCALR
jgi:hypothetical protein